MCSGGFSFSHQPPRIVVARLLPTSASEMAYFYRCARGLRLPQPVRDDIPPMARCNVLVVEDDPAIRRGLVDALKYAGYGVLECADGCTAAQTACDSTIDLVLLDVMLP